MAKVKFVELEEGIVGQAVKNVAMDAGKLLATSALAAVTGGPASGMAAFNTIKNMLYDKKTYDTEQVKEKKLNEIVGNFRKLFSILKHNNENFNDMEVGVMIDFINDYLQSFEADYRKNLGAKHTPQDVKSDMIVNMRKRLTHSDIKNLREWVRAGAKIQNKNFFDLFSEIVINFLPTFKKLELLKRKKAGQHYSPDAN